MSRYEDALEDAKFLRNYVGGRIGGMTPSQIDTRLRNIALRLEMKFYVPTPDERAVAAMNAERVDPLSDEHEALTFHPLDQKASNPKDAVGVRKAPLSVVPMGVVAEIGVGMLEGASKYGRHNYRGVGVRASVYFDATMRHLISWWEGEDLDPDSGMSHIAKALCSLAVLRDAQMQEMCEDDRPPRSEPFYPRLNEAAAQIVDKHADKKPYHYTLKDSK